MSLPFKCSERLTLGTEIELQLVDNDSYDLSHKADRVVEDVGDKKRVKHELTKSMVELNSSVHTEIALNDADRIRRLRHNGLQQKEVIKQLCHELL